MTITTYTLLLDGPLSASGPTKRQRLVSDMAQDLIRFEAFHNEADAMLSLFGSRRYPTFWIFSCLDDAIYLAKQEMVGREMSDR